MKTIQLKCKNCNAIMEVDEEKEEAVCPYCGAREKLIDSDTVAVEKIKSKTYKEMELAKMENENRKQADAAEKEEQKNYRKSKLSIVTLVFTFISLFMVFSAFESHHIVSGIIALIQTGVFAVSWLMGMRILQDKKRFLHVALAMLGILLLIPYLMFNDGVEPEKLEWPTRGLAQQLPDPKAKYGYILTDDTDKFYASVDKYSSNKFDTYITKCQSMGYTEEVKESGNDYEAYTGEGYRLSLSHYADTMTIELNAPGTYDEEPSETAVTEDTDSKETVDTENDSAKEDTSEEANTDTATGTKKEEKKETKKDKENAKDSGKVNPDLKAFLDEYEAFVDKYVAFMKKYKADSTNPSLIADYSDMLQKEMDFEQKLDAYDEDTMSAADAAYYVEVTTRCAKKMADTVQ